MTLCLFNCCALSRDIFAENLKNKMQNPSELKELYLAIK